MPLWLLLTLTSAVSFTAAQLCQRLSQRDAQLSPAFSAGWFQIVGAGINLLITLFFFGGLQFRGLWEHIPFICLSVTLFAAFNLCNFRAFRLIPAGDVSLILALRIVAIIALSLLFLNESLTFIQLFGSIVIGLGLWVVFWEKKEFAWQPGHWWALAASIALSAAFVTDAFIVRSVHVPTYMVVTFLLPGIVTWLSDPKSVQESLTPSLLRSIPMRWLSLAGVFQGLSALAIFSALSIGGQSAQVGPISNISVPLTVIAGFFLLQEKKNIWKKVFGAVIITFGAYLAT
jgi:drug/metabolite transporter (DMT)-like permease